MLRHIQVSQFSSFTDSLNKTNPNTPDEHIHAPFLNLWPGEQKRKANTSLISTFDMDFFSYSRNTNFLNSICSNSWPYNEHPGSGINANSCQESAKLEEYIVKYYDKFKEEKHTKEKKDVKDHFGVQIQPLLLTISVLWIHF